MPTKIQEYFARSELNDSSEVELVFFLGIIDRHEKVKPSNRGNIFLLHDNLFCTEVDTRTTNNRNLQRNTFPR